MTMTLYASQRSICLLLIVAASLAVCHAAEPHKPKTKLKTPAAALNPDAVKCVEMTLPAAPELLKAAMIKATAGNTITGRVLRMSDQDLNAPVKLSNTDSKRGYKSKYPQDGYEAPKEYTKPSYPSTPDLSDVDPGRGLTLQSRAFVLVSNGFIDSDTTTPDSQDFQAGYGNLYAGGVLFPAPFAVLATRTLLLKPVVNQTFLNITAANLPGSENAYAVPKSYTMIGELVDELSLETVDNILPEIKDIPSPLGNLLAGITAEKLPLSIYASTGHVPPTSRVGLDTDDCLLDLICSPGLNRLLVRGTATITTATEGKPALKKSIPVSQMNDNDWVPKGLIKVQCNLQLTQEQQRLIDTGTCRPRPQLPFPKVEAGGDGTGL